MISGQHCTMELGLPEMKGSKGRKCQDAEEGDQKEHKFIKPKQENKRGENLMQQKHGFPEKSVK